jgi:hypothetical protein
MSGRLLRTYPPQFFSGGVERISLALPQLSSGMYLLQAASGSKLAIAKMIKY